MNTVGYYYHDIHAILLTQKKEKEKKNIFFFLISQRKQCHGYVYEEILVIMHSIHFNSDQI